VIGCSLTFVSAAAATNIVANPSFEEVPYNFHWENVGPGTEELPAPSWQAQEGNVSVDLNTDKRGGLSQTLTTVWGQRYELTYWMAANGYSPSFCVLGPPKPIYEMSIAWDAQIVETASFDPNGAFNGEPLSQANMGWQQHSVEVIGTGSDTVAFASVNPDGPCGPALDNVSVSAIGPPPPPRPVVTGLTPSKGPAGGGTKVTVSGSGLTGTTQVKFGVLNATSVVVNRAGTALTAISPAEVARTVDVIVVTPGGPSMASSLDHFKYGPPTVTNLSPSSGPTVGGTAITVTGTGFGLGTEATLFKFGSIEATTVSCSSITTCTVVTPSHVAGAVAVKATVNGQSSAKAVTGMYTYN
jgi:hypothetical protein